MITFLHGDIFNSKCDILVNPVNCIGVMGAGLAREFSVRYPKMFDQYRRDCKAGHYKPGTIRIVPNGADTNEKPWICNFATKGNWREASKIEWIESGLRQLKLALKELRFARASALSVAIPKIGAGLGGLAWSEVEPLIVDILKDCDEEIEVYV